MNKTKPKEFAIRFIESILVIIYIIFEELIWNIFAKPIYQFLKSLVVLDALKNTFLQMNEYLLLFIFILIFAIAEIMGVLSGIILFNGYIFFGASIYTLKIPIAAFTFWLFDLTKDKLFSFKWLKSTYEFMMVWIHKVLNSSIHIYIKSKILIVREKIKALKIRLLGNESFTASIKNHYVLFKSYCNRYFKLNRLL